jgi:hypothetical protein
VKPPNDRLRLQRSTFLPPAITEAANALNQSVLLRLGRHLVDGNFTHHLRQSALFHHTWSIVPDKFGGQAAPAVSPSEIRCRRNPDILVPSERPFSSCFTRILVRRLHLKISLTIDAAGRVAGGNPVRFCPAGRHVGNKSQDCQTEYDRPTALPFSSGQKNSPARAKDIWSARLGNLSLQLSLMRAVEVKIWNTYRR